MAFIESGKSLDKEEHYKEMKKRMENMDTVQYTLRIPKELHKKVKIKLARNGGTFRDILLHKLLTYADES